MSFFTRPHNTSSENAVLLRKSTALDALNINVMLADASNTIVYMNKSLASFLSSFEDQLRVELPAFNMATVIGSNVDIFHKKPEHQRMMLRDLRTTHTASIRVGKLIFGLTLNPLFDEDGKRLGTVVEWADAKILENAGQVEAFNKSQAVIHFNLDGTILEANANFLKTMGYSSQEIVGKHHRLFVEPAYAQSSDYKNFWEKLNRGEFVTDRFKRIGKNGKEVWLEASYNPIFDFNGKVFKVIKFATDITANKMSILKLSEGVKELVSNLALSATELQETAAALSAAAIQGGQMSTVVASAAEELASSVSEISRQLSESTRIVSEAVDETTASQEKVSNLVASADKIGTVTSVIAQIAGQTNLLALNATIEAARAGEAGKGFAVVASEVKSLATQTARATEEIGAQVTGIQDSSQLTSQAIQQISNTISRISQISTSISGAVEEQSAATREVTVNIAGVKEAATETGKSSTTLLSIAQNVTSQAKALEAKIADFTTHL